MNRSDLQKLKLPDEPGVYFWKDNKGKVTYIGKATSLRDRLRSYFSPDVIKTRGPHIVDMVFRSKSIDWQETPSVLEALILEANLIRKYKPYYNTKEKDDKSFNCVVVTKEKFPRILLVRQKDVDVKHQVFNISNGRGKKERYDGYFGPYTSGSQLKEALAIIRKIFPFHDRASVQKDKEAFYRQVRLSPDISTTEAGRRYRKNIGRVKLILKGKIQFLIRELKKEMNTLAKAERFEEATILREKVFALEHIQDISLLKRDLMTTYDLQLRTNFRIEAYDVAHISGKQMVGVMVVVERDTPNKNEYRKFIIRGFDKANDAGALREVLVRRFAHPEWSYPSVIVVDGNVIQLNAAQEILKQFKLKIPVIMVTKDDRHRPHSISGDKKIIEAHKYAILLANHEAHRFALLFHKHRRRKTML